MVAWDGGHGLSGKGDESRVLMSPGREVAGRLHLLCCTQGTPVPHELHCSPHPIPPPSQRTFAGSANAAPSAGRRPSAGACCCRYSSTEPKGG